MKAVILGTTGYTGMILLRLLADHPDVDEIIPVSSSRFGQPAASVDPGIGKAIEKKLGLCKGNLVTLEEAVANSTSYHRDPESDTIDQHHKTYRDMDQDYILARSGCITHSEASGNVPHRVHPATLSQTVSSPSHNISSLFRNCSPTLFSRIGPRKRQPPSELMTAK